MNKLCTIISMGLAAAGFAYMFNENPMYSCAIGALVFLVVSAGFYIESKARYFWNNKFNKLVYFFSRRDREYNVESKEFTYTCVGKNEYTSKKEITIVPTCDNLDRITERFAWSAPSSRAIIRPIVEGQKIAALRQQELWTFSSVYFQHTCQKRKPFKTGSIIENLVDENNEAVPFISANVGQKTKRLIMRVCFENREAPKTAIFKVFTSRDSTDEIYREELAYDEVVKGFCKRIDFPRQHWKYVISWESH